MALTVQNLRAVGPGVEPASLLPGQIAFNVTDKVLYVGDGSNFKTAFDGTQVPGTPGNGWYAMPMDFSSLGDYYVANPGYWGDVPTDQQVLTWSTALNHPIWTSGGGGGGNQVYVVTNAQVAAAPGSTTSAKITAAIGIASPDEGDVTIVTGLPDDVYEGLYFFTTEWVKGAAYAYPSASEVIYDNTAHPTLTPTVQGAIDDLDDGLIATTAIANTANSTATSALSIANAALPKAGGTMTGTIVAEDIDIQSGYSLLFANGSNGTVIGISDSVISIRSDVAASSAAVNVAYNLAGAALPRSGGIMTGPITFVSGQLFPISGIQIATTGQLGVVQIGTNVDVTAGGVISVKTASATDLGLVRTGANVQNAAGTISVLDSTTAQKGVVQLVNNTSSPLATDQALTAAMGASLQTQINGITISGTVTLAGSIDASTGLLQSVTTQGSAAGFVINQPLPAAAPDPSPPGNNNYYVIVTNPGTFTPPGGSPVTSENGDWILSDGVMWQELEVGARPAYASTVSAGVIALSDNAQTQAGTNTLLAVTPATLQSKLSDSTSLTSSTTIASSTAVKAAYNIGAAAVPCSAITGKGAVLTGTAAGTPSALPVGTNGQVLVVNLACSTGLEWVSNTPGDVTSVTATSPVTANNTDPQNPVIGIDAASTTQPGAVQLNDTIASTSTTEAATANAVKTAYDAAAAAIPCSTITAQGDILVGDSLGNPTALPLGTTGQVLIVNTACAAGLEWVNDTPGDVTSVTGTAPIAVDNTDPQNPIVSIDAASTTACGAVQLNDTVSSSSTTEAATANALKTTYDLANAAVPCSSFTALGELLVGTSSGNYSALSVGTNQQVLIADSTCATGLKWGNACYVPDACFTAKGQLIVGTGTGTYVALTPGTNGQLLVPNSACANGVEWVTCQGISICGYSCTATPFNTAIGAQAGDSVTSATGLTAIGYQAGTAVTTGGSNTFVGWVAGSSVTTGSQNVAVGVSSGGLITTGIQNTHVGWEAGDATNASYTVALGSRALGGNHTQNGTVAVGANSLAASTSGVGNTAVGFCSGALITTGARNTVVGSAAFCTATSASDSTVIGYGAGAAVTLGGNNILIGAGAGDTITTGFNNTIIGDVNGSASLTGNLILAAGTTVKFQANNSGAWSYDGTNFGTAGQFLASQGSAATPVWCTLSLACVPCSAFTASGQLLAGTGTSTFTALNVGTNGQFLVADSTCTGGLKWSTECFVNDACFTAQGGLLAGTGAGTFSELALGTSGQFLVVDTACSTGLKWATECFVNDACFTAKGAILAGTAAGAFSALPVGTNGQVLVPNSSCTTGLEWITTTALSLAGYTCTATPFNTAFGALAGDSITTGQSNTSVGYNAGTNITTGFTNVLVGSCAGTGVSVQSDHVAIGNQTLVGTLDINNSGLTAVGTCALRAVTTGLNNLGIGFRAGLTITSGGCNIAIGACALDSVTSSANNIGIGFCALTSITTGSENMGIGTLAGASVSSGANNYSIGYLAGCAVSAGTDNTFLGDQAGRNTTGSFNVFLGGIAGCGVTSGTCSIAIGYDALNSTFTGTQAVAIGRSAGTNLTTGSCSTLIGHSAGAGNTTSCNTAVGWCALATNTTGSCNTVVGIGAGQQGATPGSLVAVGHTAAQNANNTGTVAIGRAALQNATTGVNTAIGYFALQQHITAANSTAVGYQAGCAATGGGHTLIGNNSGCAITTGTNNTIVGPYAGTATLSNNAVIADGAGNIKLQVNENGAVGVGTTPSYGTPGQLLSSVGTGGAATWTSSLPQVAAPSVSTAAGVQGQIASDSTYFYMYTGGRWQRIAWDTTSW